MLFVMPRIARHYVRLAFALMGSAALLTGVAPYADEALADASGSATVYRWVDAQGVVHYSDHPRPGAQRLQIQPAQTFHHLTTVDTPNSAAIGPPPACPYGYYDYAPYDCAPDGYYGPEWFVNGVFVGAGPWFRGHADFRGHVDSHYDPRHGYQGAVPQRGQRPDAGRPAGHLERFHADEARDERGNVPAGTRSAQPAGAARIPVTSVPPAQK